MPEALFERGALPDLASIGKFPPGVVAAEIRGLALAIMTARKGKLPELTARLRDDFGLALIDAPRRAFGRGMACLGIGPSRWLLVAWRSDANMVDVIAGRLAGLASLVDQSGGLVVLRVSGPDARRVFEKGLPIDLDPSAFPSDGCATTSIAHIGLTIWTTGDADSFEVAVGRSFAAGFWRWLSESAAEFGLGVATIG